MAVRIVHIFKVVDVHDDQGMSALGEHILGKLLKSHFIVKAGEHVRLCFSAQAVFFKLFFVDV